MIHSAELIGAVGFRQAGLHVLKEGNCLNPIERSQKELGYVWMCGGYWKESEVGYDVHLLDSGREEGGSGHCSESSCVSICHQDLPEKHF